MQPYIYTLEECKEIEKEYELGNIKRLLEKEIERRERWGIDLKICEILEVIFEFKPYVINGIELNKFSDDKLIKKFNVISKLIKLKYGY